jgi:inorganic triphosphatase YgiF
VGRALRDLDRQQAALFFLTCASIRRHQPAVLQPLFDEDVVEAAAALASTFDTAERGVVYEHRPSSVPAERLVAALKAAFTEAGRHSGASFGRDAALVLHRVEEAAREMAGHDPGHRRAFLDLLGRILQRDESAAPDGSDQAAPGDRSPLIVP